MRVTLHLYAGLRERAGAEEVVVDDLPEPLDVAGLKRELERRHPAWGSLEGVRGVLGTSYVDEATPLSEGAVVSLLPPVSGGAPDEPLEEGVFELREDPLELAEAWGRVAHPSCGAVVVFTGTTRETNRGQEVERLDYEAFGSMAQAEMARILAECRARFAEGAPVDAPGGDPPRLRMLVLHRVGTVGVGEPSVVVAVASPHRDPAFAAARFLIDELKARVPLWKKEVYAAGHHWIGERS